MRSFMLALAATWCLVGCVSPPAQPSSPIQQSALNDVSRDASISTARQALIPEVVLVDQFGGQLDRAIRKAFRQTGPVVVHTLASDLVVVPIAPRAASVYTFPDPGGNQVAIPNDVSKVTFMINISLPDKLSVGKTASWLFYVSADNGQTWDGVGGGGWTSYGPAGFFNNFLQEWNPDPRSVLTLFSSTPIVNHRGKLLRGILTLPQPLEAGATITTE